jgi:hypothetical protein
MFINKMLINIGLFKKIKLAWRLRSNGNGSDKQLLERYPLEELPCIN